ncbi:hypothetical protein D8M04_11190 [Oceanobacillus piezotolerans]|uniref:Uncharacterized protein n=1 Tax=Oceanobacillus piezotolerans TaxID=2448030 RepID=A0A498DBK4_9BACI|nr:hypothetical protein [Oceanobacillus piezotolerans]RLL45410.1 hypothetical protein D8M04_11190 [Oceanobacillus piezotolerans]
MPDYNKDLINALEEHTRAINDFVQAQNLSYNKPVIINYSDLLLSIDKSLKEINKKLPNQPLNKY